MSIVQIKPKHYLNSVQVVDIRLDDFEDKASVKMTDGLIYTSDCTFDEFLVRWGKSR